MMMQSHSPEIGLEKLERIFFNFTYTLPGEEKKSSEKHVRKNVISDDYSLMQAVNMAFQGPDEDKLIIRFFIHELTDVIQGLDQQ